MTRYFRLYLHFIRFSLSKALEFRLDFFFRIFMDLLYYAVSISFYQILYQHTDLIGGWTAEQTNVFVASLLVVDALHMTIFANNCWWFPIFINQGDMDYYLTKPVSPLFFLSLRDIAFNSAFNLLCALGILVYFISELTIAPSWTDLLIFAGLLINGTLLSYIFQMFFLLPVFWTQSPRGFEDTYYAISRVEKYPDRIMSKGVRVVFTFIFPVALFASYPNRILFDGNFFEDFLILSATSLFFILVYLVYWKIAVRRYSSASS